MKVYVYSYYESWGAGQGIVIAESIDEAIKLMKAPYDPTSTVKELFPDLEFEEIDISKPQVIDHSWCE